MLFDTTVHSGGNISRFKHTCGPIEVSQVILYYCSEIGFFLELDHLIQLGMSFCVLNFWSVDNLIHYAQILVVCRYVIQSFMTRWYCLSAIFPWVKDQIDVKSCQKCSLASTFGGHLWCPKVYSSKAWCVRLAGLNDSSCGILVDSWSGLKLVHSCRTVPHLLSPNSLYETPLRMLTSSRKERQTFFYTLMTGIS